MKDQSEDIMTGYRDRAGTPGHLGRGADVDATSRLDEVNRYEVEVAQVPREKGGRQPMIRNAGCWNLL